VNQLLRLLAPLRAKLSAMVARAVVRSIQDGTKLQELELEVLAGERVRRAERFQQYGLTSVPFPGAECVVVFAQGNRDHPLVVALEDRADRPTALSAGEVMLYARSGARVHLKADGTLRLSSPTKVEIEAPMVSAEASTELEFTSGTSRVTLNPAGVTIAGPLVDFTQA